MDNIWIWIAFVALVLGMLALDLGVFHRRAHEVSVREAASWTAVWVALALLFGLGVIRFMGKESGLEFYTGYLIEKALSIDNIFVFVLLFSYFDVPPKYQHRVLFWGILGALLMRGAMIAAGALLLERFHWIIYLFGAFLIATGFRMAFSRETNIRVEANPVVRLLRRFIPIGGSFDGQRFFTHETVYGRRRLIATPLLVVLLLVETTDLIFALDSIPAVFAITRDPFIVFTSNVFAILGLRALYFVLAGIIHKFHFLKLGLALVLGFVGVKMVLAQTYPLPTAVSLGIIAGILATAVGASLLFPRVAIEHAPVEEETATLDSSVETPRNVATIER